MFRKPPHGGLIPVSAEEGTSRPWSCLSDEQIPSQGGQLSQYRRDIFTAAVQPGQVLQGSLRIPLGHHTHELCRLQIARQAQGIQDAPLVHRPVGAGTLVQ